MKTVYIMRHAMSGPARMGAEDIDRTLSEKGRESAVRMGGYMRDEGIVPDSALVSAATRTRQTWDALSDEAGWDVSAQVEKAFYLARESVWLSAINQLGAETSTAILVGHHPGVDTLAMSLAGQGAPSALAEMSTGFPTCALAELAFDCSWGEIGAGTGTLVRFVTPRHLMG